MSAKTFSRASGTSMGLGQPSRTAPPSHSWSTATPPNPHNSQAPCTAYCPIRKSLLLHRPISRLYRKTTVSVPKHPPKKKSNAPFRRAGLTLPQKLETGRPYTQLVVGAMKQRTLSSRSSLCHRRPVIAQNVLLHCSTSIAVSMGFSGSLTVLRHCPAALQHLPICSMHSWYLWIAVVVGGGGGGCC